MLRITIVSFFLFISAALMAQKGADNSGYCLMRVFDVNKFAASGSGFIGSKIIITYDNGEQEEVALQAYTEKTEPENLKVIVATLNKLKVKGYLLMSANSTGDQGNIVTDYVLLRQQF